MPSKMNKKALNTLKRLEKHADNVYDGMTPDAPQNIIDSYRAVEGAEIKTHKERMYLDRIELSRRIMNIDNEYYHVSDDVAHKLVDYIEQSDFDVLEELELEQGIKKKELQSLYEELSVLSKKDYISIEDFNRARSHRKKNIKIFEKKLLYTEEIINTIKEFEDESREEMEDNSLYPDFSYTMTNNNNSLDAAGKFK